MSKQITNPFGAYGTSGIDENGPQTTWPFVANGSINANDVVTFATPTADDISTLTVKQADVSADDPASVAGVALEGAADGESVLICMWGICLVNIGADTVAADELASFHASTDGAATGSVADATTISGDTFGVFRSAEIGSTNTAILFVRPGS